jgi:Zn-dependent protease
LVAVTSLGIAEAVIFIALFVLISGPVHECAHAFVAWRLGDDTAKLFGRISLDPIRHFDLLGGSLLIGSTILNLLSSGSPSGFGWAKPTPVNPYNLRGRHADSLVAAAGPLSNLALAAIFAVGFRILWGNGAVEPNNHSAINMVQLVFFTGVRLNVMLMVFNLIPIPPLDGSHVLLDFLDPRTANNIRGVFNQYGMLLLVVVVLFGGAFIFQLVNPIVSFLIDVPLVPVR